MQNLESVNGIIVDGNEEKLQSIMDMMLANQEAEKEKTELERLKTKKMLSINEFARYMGLGDTKARELLKNTRLGFRVRINNSIMINREKLDEYLDKNSY